MTELVVESSRSEWSVGRKRIGGALLAVYSLLALTSSSDDLQPSLPPETKIVAMGDSYTSGHGNGDVRDRYNDCLRDPVSYAYKIADQLDLLDGFSNEACSGATPEEIINGRFGEKPQIEALSSQTDFVLLTTGANATNLTELLNSCADAECSLNNQHVTKLLDYVSSQSFIERLKHVYRSIAKNAPNAAIIVVEYPQIVNTEAICGDIIGQGGMGFALEEAIRALNSSISTAVNEMKIEGVKVFLSPATPDIDLCGTFGTSFFTDPTNPRALGHPTGTGHEAIAKSVEETMAAAQYTMDYNEYSSTKSIKPETRRR